MARINAEILENVEFGEKWNALMDNETQCSEVP